MSDIPQKILVYLDGSDGSHTASQYAIYFAKINNMELFSVYGINNSALDDLLVQYILLPSEKEEYRNDLIQDAEKYGRQFERMANEKNVIVETLTINEQSDTKTAIIELIQEKEISCVIVGELPHRRSRQETFYSDNEYIAYSAPCSVLVVKDPFRVEKLFNSV